MDVGIDSFRGRLAKLDRNRKILLVGIFLTGMLFLTLLISLLIFVLKQSSSQEGNIKPESILSSEGSESEESSSHSGGKGAHEIDMKEFKDFFGNKDFCLHFDDMELFEKFSELPADKVKELSQEFPGKHVVFLHNNASQVLSRAKEKRDKTPSRIDSEILKEIEPFFYNKSNTHLAMVPYEGTLYSDEPRPLPETRFYEEPQMNNVKSVLAFSLVRIQQSYEAIKHRGLGGMRNLFTHEEMAVKTRATGFITDVGKITDIGRKMGASGRILLSDAYNSVGRSLKFVYTIPFRTKGRILDAASSSKSSIVKLYSKGTAAAGLRALNLYQSIIVPPVGVIRESCVYVKVNLVSSKTRSINFFYSLSLRSSGFLKGSYSQAASKTVQYYEVVTSGPKRMIQKVIYAGSQVAHGVSYLLTPLTNVVSSVVNLAPKLLSAPPQQARSYWSAMKNFFTPPWRNVSDQASIPITIEEQKSDEESAGEKYLSIESETSSDSSEYHSSVSE